MVAIVTAEIFCGTAIWLDGGTKEWQLWMFALIFVVFFIAATSQNKVTGVSAPDEEFDQITNPLLEDIAVWNIWKDKD